MTKTGVTVRDVRSQDFIAEYAAHLKRSGKMKLPDWVDIVKTGTHKELAPYDSDWYYVRAAAIARRVYLRKGSGVGGFRKAFGGASRRGTAPSHFNKASGRVIRHVCQELQKIKVVEVDEKGGRKITSTGSRELDRIAGRVARKSRAGIAQ